MLCDNHLSHSINYMNSKYIILYYDNELLQTSADWAVMQNVTSFLQCFRHIF